MKNSILINSSFFNNFWAKVMEITNYFQNKLSTKSKNYGEIILKKA